MGFSKTQIAFVLFFGLLALTYFHGSKDDFDAEKLIKNKNVLVTGASYGIGRVTALRFCQLGANVFITARTEEKLQNVVEECKRVGAKGAVHGYIPGDMADLEQSENVVHESAKRLGGLDFLILNHAFNDPIQYNMYQYTKEDMKLMKKTFDINFFSYVTMASAAIKYLRKSAGKVAVISSVAGRKADILISIYVATKYAVEGFFRSIDLENYFLETNVSFTVVTLGVVDTGVDISAEVMERVTDVMSRYEVDPEKSASVYNSPANVDECSDQIIRSTALKPLSHCDEFGPRVTTSNNSPQLFRCRVGLETMSLHIVEMSLYVAITRQAVAKF